MRVCFNVRATHVDVSDVHEVPPARQKLRVDVRWRRCSPMKPRHGTGRRLPQSIVLCGALLQKTPFLSLCCVRLPFRGELPQGECWLTDSKKGRVQARTRSLYRGLHLQPAYGSQVPDGTTRRGWFIDLSPVSWITLPGYVESAVQYGITCTRR